MLKRGTLKRGRRKEPTALEKRHWNRIAAMGCLACGAPAQIHHVTAYADRMGRIARSHQLVAPLCQTHHQAIYDNASMPVSVERLGHRGFFREHGIDLFAVAERLWAETLELERRAA